MRTPCCFLPLLTLLLATLVAGCGGTPIPSLVFGRVVDANDRPVSGAEIILAPYSVRTAANLNARTTTDRYGRFEFPNMAPGNYDLHVHRGFLTRTLPTDVTNAPWAPVVDLGKVVLGGPSVALSGQVVDQEGRPIADAGVALGSRVRRTGYSPSSVACDETGHFLLPGLEPASRVTLQVLSGSFQGREVVVDVPAASDAAAPLRIVLPERRLKVAGTVYDSAGQPVQRAQVQLVVPSQNLDSTTWTDQEGHFRLEGRPGHAEVIAHTGDASAAPLAFEITEDQSVTGLAIVLRPETVVEGRVTAPDGRPVPGVWVELRAPLGYFLSPFGSTFSDSEGRYRLPGVPLGTWQIVVVQNFFQVMDAEEVRIVPGTNVVDFVGNPVSSDDSTGLLLAKALLGEIRQLSWRDFFPGRLTLSGQVLLDGKPAQDAQILVLGRGGSRSDENGGFRVEHLAPGTYWIRVTVSTPYIRHGEVVELSADRQIRIDLVTGRITGRVVDAATGEPLAGAEVQLAPLDFEWEGALLTGGGPRRSDRQGRFSFDKVLNGTYRVMARRSGHAPAQVQVDVRPESASEVELALPAAESLALDVRLASGKSPTEIDVAVLDAARNPWTIGKQAPARDGRFHLRELAAGTWGLRISAAETAVVEIEVTVPGEPVPVELPSQAKLHLEVPALAGEAGVASASLFDAQGRRFAVPSGTGGLLAHITVRRGELLVNALPPGDWRVEVTAADDRTWTGTATTVAGETTELVLE